MNYAIVVPAFNEEQLLPSTLASLRKAMAETDKTGELIVVDNNSSDTTAEVARLNGADQVVFEPHNQIAKARNAGASATNAEWLIFVDADTVAPPATLRQALDFLETGTVAGGGALVEVDQPVGRMFTFILNQWNRTSGLFSYAAGSFFFCRRDAFEAANGFDESVYAGEEVWLAKRIKRWAKSRDMAFEIISDPPVMTSGRKSEWFSDWQFAWQFATILICPWVTRSRRLCGVWYRRP